VPPAQVISLSVAKLLQFIYAGCRCRVLSRRDRSPGLMRDLANTTLPGEPPFLAGSLVLPVPGSTAVTRRTPPPGVAGAKSCGGCDVQRQGRGRSRAHRDLDGQPAGNAGLSTLSCARWALDHSQAGTLPAGKRAPNPPSGRMRAICARSSAVRTSEAAATRAALRVPGIGTMSSPCTADRRRPAGRVRFPVGERDAHRAEADLRDLELGRGPDGLLDGDIGVRAMLLIQVDVVGAKPGERTLDPLPDVLRPAVEHRKLTSNQGPNDTEFRGQATLSRRPAIALPMNSSLPV
jgi:hypothetical protein